MVRFVDLDETDGLEDDVTLHHHRPLPLSLVGDAPWQDRQGGAAGELTKLSILLSCYPIISQLVRYVDLNTLHELSRTCRQFRENLLQHRTLLMQQTLRCRNEPVELGTRLGKALSASVQQWRAYGSQRITSGRLGTCARDQVGECRRCGDAVCRNCVMKPPSARDIKGRHRRLCRTCMKCPIQRLTVTNPVVPDDEHESLPTTYSREPCACELEGVWICEPCGQLLRSANTTYLRGWAWRARYSACGGVGAGLGEGNEGVECGRGSNCLDARIIVNETECDADELAAHEGLIESAADGGCRHHWAGNSYNTHEIVGLGGKVKKKIKKKVLVGAIVKEYEDERVPGKVLRREQEGANRSWCGWCLRVVVGKKDVEQASGSSDSVDSVDSLATI